MYAKYVCIYTNICINNFTINRFFKTCMNALNALKKRKIICSKICHISEIRIKANKIYFILRKMLRKEFKVSFRYLQ